MKRSEMIKQIQDELYNMLFSASIHEVSTFLEIRATRILNKIEEAGMLPPFSDKVFQLNCRTQQEPTGNEWEPEND